MNSSSDQSKNNFAPQFSIPKLVMAPMHGVVDGLMRRTIESLGGADLYVTEFLRVTSLLLPKHVVYKSVPELKTGKSLVNDKALMVQLLGGDLGALSENACQVAEMGAVGIDLNFGCPAKTVNRHDGGATLLLYPQRIFKIVERIRQDLPNHIPLTVKMRLGFHDHSLLIDNAQAAESGGALWLTVHGRTKLQMYDPPAHWDQIQRVRQSLRIPIIANGDITSYQDALRCQEVTGCSSLMIGRGALANPFLFQAIRRQSEHAPEALWPKLNEAVLEFFDAAREQRNEIFAMARVKNWLNYLRRAFTQAEVLFQQIKLVENATHFRSMLTSQFTCQLTSQLTSDHQVVHKLLIDSSIHSSVTSEVLV